MENRTGNLNIKNCQSAWIQHSGGFRDRVEVVDEYLIKALFGKKAFRSHAPIVLEPNGRPFGSKSIGKWYIQSDSIRLLRKLSVYSQFNLPRTRNAFPCM